MIDTNNRVWWCEAEQVGRNVRPTEPWGIHECSHELGCRWIDSSWDGLTIDQQAALMAERVRNALDLPAGFGDKERTTMGDIAELDEAIERYEEAGWPLIHGLESMADAARAYRRLRQSASTLLYHLATCEICELCGTSYCYDIGNIRAILRDDLPPESVCPVEGCPADYPHYHHDTLDGEELVRVRSRETS